MGRGPSADPPVKEGYESGPIANAAAESESFLPHATHAEEEMAGMATSSNASDAATSMAARRAASSTAFHASHSGDSRFTSARDCIPDAE